MWGFSVLVLYRLSVWKAHELNEMVSSRTEWATGLKTLNGCWPGVCYKWEEYVNLTCWILQNGNSEDVKFSLRHPWILCIIDRYSSLLVEWRDLQLPWTFMWKVESLVVTFVSWSFWIGTCLSSFSSLWGESKLTWSEVNGMPVKMWM